MFSRKTVPLLGSIFLFLFGAPSEAQTAPVDDDLVAHKEYPWAKGVSEEARKESTRLFFEARRHYHDSLFALAADKYRAALAACNCHHPAAHYNLVLSLVNLDRPVEMYENLIAAMENGLERLSKERFEQAKNFKVLLEKQLVAIDLRCDVPGAKVTIDGRQVLTPPGRYRGMERPGVHTVLAFKHGMVTNQVFRQMDGGQKIALSMDLKTEEELTVYERRWAAWKPWTLLGAGAAVALAGGGLHYAAIKQTQAADRGVVDCSGCGPRRDLTHERLNAATMEKVAIVGYSVGGAAIATGAVLAFLNRAKTHMRPYEVDVAPAPPEQQPKLGIVPLLDSHSLALLANYQILGRNSTMRPLLPALAIPAFLLTACLAKMESLECAPDYYCPKGTKCSADGIHCLTSDCGDGAFRRTSSATLGPPLRQNDATTRAPGPAAAMVSSNKVAGEACDPGPTATETADCNYNCQPAKHGDGVVNHAFGELCDGDSAGKGNGKDCESDRCNANCTPSACGDDIVNASAGEQCDPGKAGESAACNFNCTLTHCGDGMINRAAGEECDDKGESARCNANCKLTRCGDGIINKAAGEHCDPGPAGETVECNSNCTRAKCGDGVVNRIRGEECDDKGETARCTVGCHASRCGDGLLRTRPLGSNATIAESPELLTYAASSSLCGDAAAREKGADPNLSGSFKREVTFSMWSTAPFVNVVFVPWMHHRSRCQ